MSEIARFSLDDGEEVLVEVGEGGGVSPAGHGGKVLVEARESLENAFAQVRSAGASALSVLADMPRRPDEIELKFGIKLDAQAGAIIARTGATAQFEIKLRWQREPSSRGRADEPEPDQERAEVPDP